MSLLLIAVILGIVEGITEFLPVSSTGHLILAADLLNFNDPGKVFEIAIQMGAILAVVWLFRGKLLAVAGGLTATGAEQTRALRFCANQLIAFLPAAIIGVLLHHAIKTYLFSPVVVCVSLVVGGVLILLIERIKPNARVLEVDNVTPKTALLIGFCQCLAMIPGVSRSGATIMGALMFGVGRKAAAEFSFFLAIPTLTAACVFDLAKNWRDLSTGNLELIGVGFIAAFISALAVVKVFMLFIERHGFNPFAWYRIVLGALWLFWLIR
jgi:undecaprenyl-diphosphatase